MSLVNSFSLCFKKSPSDLSPNLPQGNRIVIDDSDMEKAALKVYHFVHDTHQPAALSSDDYPDPMQRCIDFVGKLKKTLLGDAQTLLEDACQFDESARLFYHVYPKPTKIEKLENYQERRIYHNGIIEVLKPFINMYKGSRIFSDGKKEVGEFNRDGSFESGYCLKSDGKILFIHPTSLIAYQEAGGHQFKICEVEGALVVLKIVYNEESKQKMHIIEDRPVVDVLLKAIQCIDGKEGPSITPILFHEDFKKYQRSFLSHFLDLNGDHFIGLFKITPLAALDVIQYMMRCGLEFDPLQCIDPLSKRHFFFHAAALGNRYILDELIQRFPNHFLKVGIEIINKLIQQNKYHLIIQMIKMFETLGGTLDPYHVLWISIVKGIKPDKQFKTYFDQMGPDQKLKLYQIAYLYNNTFVYEPAIYPICSNLYSINLMWINKNRTIDGQKFLLGEGVTPKEREEDFKERFIKPVSKWVKKNPDSRVNIWIDSEMTCLDIIKNSEEMLHSCIEKGMGHVFQFRDVRSIELVQSHPAVFSEKMPIYFRVDLLRAIAADDLLRKKEIQYFVYGDMDMKALSKEELFDQRTINSLNDLGFVMAKGGGMGFENGFQILNGDHALFMASHREVIIDLSIEMAIELPNKIHEQQIYDTYPAMLTHLLDADGRYGKCILLSKNSSSFSLDNRSKFRYDHFGRLRGSRLPLEEEVEIKQLAFKKPVRLPPSHLS